MPKVKRESTAAHPAEVHGAYYHARDPASCDDCFNETGPATADNTRAYGERVLVRFESKPKMSDGKDGVAIHLPLSQQVEPNWARCVSVGHLVREKFKAGDRLLVAAHMNGDRGPDGTHWLEERFVLGVEE